MMLSKAVVAVGFCCAVLVGQTKTPGVIIDGHLDEPVWRNADPEKLAPSEAGVPSETGGEVRAIVVGRYLYVGAMLREPTGRITARLIGRNPSWEEEDRLVIHCGADSGSTDRIVQINPLGAYSVEKAVHVPSHVLDVFPYSLEKPDSQVVYRNATRFLVATSIGERGWTAEAAIPLGEFSAPGSERITVRIERIRAPRPGSPEQRWHWPEKGPAARISALAAKSERPAPVFRPAPIGNTEAPLVAGRLEALPAADSKWDDPVWRNVPAWTLLRDEPMPRRPRFPTEIKVVHDGRMMGVFARLVEPDAPLTRPRENNSPAAQDDSFEVYLATSGSAYAQFVVNAAGSLLNTSGVFGGPRLSRARGWTSGARVAAEKQAGAWTVRIDIPLEPAAKILNEDSVPAEWRVLFRRIRHARNGEPLEASALPVTQSDTPLCTPRYGRLDLVDAAPSILAKPAPEKGTRGLAALDGRVLSPDERKKLAIAEMVNQQLAGRIKVVADAVRSEWDQVGTRADWERFRAPRIAALKASLGEFPARTELRTRVTKEFQGQGYRRQDLLYQSRPGMWVPANLYLPAEPASQMPGIVIVHSHHRPRTQGELQDMGILWARAGCAVLIMDQIGHGERIQNYPWNREPYHSRYVMGMQLYLAGESLLKWIVWDVMRGIDLLEERKDINRDQIILLGAVAAGGEPAAVTAALDPRVAAVVPFNFGRAEPGWGEWESTRCLRRSIIDQFFPWVISASVAPRRLVYANEMGWEHYKDNLAWERFKKLFALYGVPDNIDEAHGFGSFPGPGECNNIGPAQRRTLYPALKRWFGIPIPASEPNDRRPEAELASLNSVNARELNMTSLHDLALEAATSKLNSARAEMAKSDPQRRREELRTRLAAKLGDIEPNRRPEAKLRWKRQLAGAAIEGVTLQIERGIIVPLLMLRPANASNRPLPVVVAVSQGGKERFLAHRSSDIEALLAAGVSVCLPDVRGTGETSSEMLRGLNSEEDSAAATEFMLGGTILGGRLKDLRSVLAYLAARADVDNRNVALWGDTFAPVNPPRFVVDELIGWQVGPETEYQAEPLGGLLALLGGFYEDGVRAIAARGGLVAYTSILEDQFAYVPNDIIVPGVLEVADVADVAGALSPRPLVLAGLVDGRNRLVREPELKGRFRSAFQSYREAPIRLQVRSEMQDASLVAWMARQLKQSSGIARR